MSSSETARSVRFPNASSALNVSEVVSPFQKYFSSRRVQTWSGVNDFDRYPKPLRCDRLQRLPPTRSSARKSCSTDELNFSLLSKFFTSDMGKEMDLNQKVHQLEKSLVFITEEHVSVLKKLHEELTELKNKNQELQFDITMGTGTGYKRSGNREDTCCSENKVKTEKLEKEINKLRAALREALKSNTILITQVELLKREQYLNSGSVPLVPYQPIQFESCPEGMSRAPTPSGPSPKIDEYRDTIYQIDQASTRSRVSSDHISAQKGDRPGHVDKRERHNQQNQIQRLPRLPLRNHVNMPPQQYELHCRRKGSADLPALKQEVIPIINRAEKSRKNKSNPRPRVSNAPHQ
ncbi:uncharacterized protein LOC106469769 [Limulus polyphemus]|uniref:Uncharacterized protein LOC106469769 n=1 Tax=Limulus polyphemus TaxID=6850 RepID=A0ABM1TDS4_LIMPO|nr:uncharacterized protein LOC106469769 [Limulus polyphemus]XP_022254030.1 uncharacterized protein LOC106469769 [Limulus polyphemus]